MNEKKEWNKKNSVTIVSSMPPVQGVSAYTVGLVSELSKLVSVDVLGFNKIYPAFLYPGKMYDEKAKLVQDTETLRVHNVLNWYNPFGWVFQAFKVKSSLVHMQAWSPALTHIYLTLGIVFRMKGKRIVMTVHNIESHEKSFLKKFLTSLVFGIANEYIVHSQENKKELEIKVKGKKKVTVIPHGIIIPPLSPVTGKEARKRLNISDEDKILLCFGNIRDYKGLDVVLRALSHIKDKKVKLLIAGQCWGDWEKYQKIIDEHKLEKRVIKRIEFIPADELELLFKVSDLVLLPYKNFNAQTGVAPLILPFGVPFIVSKTGGLPSLVRRSEALIEQDDDGELAEKIEDILSDKKLYAELKKDVAEVRQELSWDSIAKRTVTEVYGE